MKAFNNRENDNMNKRSKKLCLEQETGQVYMPKIFY